MNNKLPSKTTHNESFCQDSIFLSVSSSVFSGPFVEFKQLKSLLNLGIGQIIESPKTLTVMEKKKQSNAEFSQVKISKI